MSEDPVLDRCERMLHGLPSELHGFWRHPLFHPVQSILVEMSCQAASRGKRTARLQITCAAICARSFVHGVAVFEVCVFA